MSLIRLLLITLLLGTTTLASADTPGNTGLGSLFGNSDSVGSTVQFLPVQQAFRAGIVEADAERIQLQFDITPEYYLYRHRLKFDLQGGDGQIAAIQLPDGVERTDEFFGDVEVYYNSLNVTLELTPGSQPASQLRVEYQGCADAGLCYPPETLLLDLPTAASTGAPSPANPASPGPTDDNDSSLWWSLLLLFAAGLALTFTPCVLPMVPILTSMVLGRENIDRPRAFVLSLSYVLGMALTFALVGALIGLFGAALNIQARLQSPWVLGVFAVFFVIFALAMFDVFNMRLPAFIRGPAEQLGSRTRGGSIPGAAVMGALSSLVVSPCISAPLAGALVYISATGDAWGGALQLFALAIGMGVPLILVAMFGKTLLPRSGPWLNQVKQAFGFGLLGVAIWLLERVIPGPLSLALWAALAAGIAVQLGLFDRTPRHGMARVAQAAALLFAVYAAATLVGALAGNSDPLRPLQSLRGGASVAAAGTESHYFTQVTTAAEVGQQLAQAREAGQPAIVELSADWCISCKVIEREIINHPSVRAGLDGFVRVQLDVTDNTPDQRAWLTEQQLFGPPAFLFLDSQGREIPELRIQGEVPRDTFIQHMNAAVEAG
ncbi:thiol:disulfide interchange protein [Pseudomonas saudimassiliensis]|uniref:Thiol:disulfide interchange protein DsbD n=1 Tax=Pseudomonas saudimassiliensis TaxID=1461581 RepID=A0A078MFP4_9PSED|nr:protein-disulfide reductase DsbD [Pseudomonas saudimassiliensis]CEA06128.1 thiol:disulfide interchange protein [Pseudomonas saudimassiliensis]CEF27553.1 thiol:disulfide interchange protein [Pseudomonas saudimassiliensis]